jgi:hypothetical protein
MLETGFVILALAVLLWLHLSIPCAVMACGRPRPTADALRRRFMLAAIAWVLLVMGLAAVGALKRWDLRPPPLMGLLVCITRRWRCGSAMAVRPAPWCGGGT